MTWQKSADQANKRTESTSKLTGKSRPATDTRSSLSGAVILTLRVMLRSLELSERKWQRFCRKAGICVTCLSMLLIQFLISPAAQAQIPTETAINILIGEGANQGLQGMQGIAEVLRRRNTTSGFCTLSRRDLKDFIRRQGPSVRRQAEKAWRLSKRSNLTKGATHYENVKAFGEPYWAKKMMHTVTIKDHRFYRERGKK